MNIKQILEAHGIEVWHGYAVDTYSIHGKRGESFVLITDLGGRSGVLQWLGYCY